MIILQATERTLNKTMIDDPPNNTYNGIWKRKASQNNTKEVDFMICSSCGNNMPEGSKFCTRCGSILSASTPAPAPAPAPATSSQGVNFDFNTNTASPATASKRYEYKILSQKDKWFSGKFDPMVLEQAMNAYAQQGWRVIGCATADIPGFTAARQEFITILEREV